MSKAKHARHAATNNQQTEINFENEIESFESDTDNVDFDNTEEFGSLPDAFYTNAPVQTDFAAMNTFNTVDMGKATRSRTPLKVFGIVLAIIFGLAAIVYVAGAVVFMGRFFPNTVIRDADVSLKTPVEYDELIQSSMSNYKLKLEGEDFSLTLSAMDAGLTLDGETLATTLIESNNPWAWPYEIFQDHDETESLVASFNESGLADVISAAVDEFNATATAPKDAYVAYDETKGQFAIVPEEKGTMLSADAITKLAAEAVVALDTSVKITDSELALPAVLSTDEVLTQAAASANAMILTDVNFTMAGTTAITLDGSIISSWVVFGDDWSVSLDESALEAWVAEVKSTYSTTGSKRTYTRPDGKQFEVEGGSYGWQVDGDALLEEVKAAIESDKTGDIEMPCTHTCAAFSTAGGQDWPARYIDVDLTEQYARMYNDASEVIWESAIVSGKPKSGSEGSITPAGVYYITTKQSPATLKGKNDDGTEYESHVTYWMPFINNTIGLHDANWQSAFGGTRYRDGYGSHGCVNLPTSKAAELYNIIELADVVVVHW